MAACDMTQVRPGNALRLVAIFAQLPTPAFPLPAPVPSQTITLPNGETVTVFGTLYNPPGPLVVTLHDPSQPPGMATTLPGTPTMGSTGIWYLDALIPLSGWPGDWSHRWYQQGVAVDSNFLQEHTFRVVATDY